MIYLNIFRVGLSCSGVSFFSCICSHKVFLFDDNIVSRKHHLWHWRPEVCDLKMIVIFMWGDCSRPNVSA